MAELMSHVSETVVPSDKGSYDRNQPWTQRTHVSETVATGRSSRVEAHVREPQDVESPVLSAEQVCRLGWGVFSRIFALHFKTALSCLVWQVHVAQLVSSGKNVFFTGDAGTGAPPAPPAPWLMLL